MKLKILSHRPTWKTTGYWFILPALIFYIGFVVIPIIVNTYYSMHEWDGANPVKTFIAFGNYANLLKDEIFWKALYHNIFWIITSMVLPVGTGLILAVLLASERIKFKLLFRVCYFIPAVLSLTIVAYIWDWIYNPSFGVLNTIFNNIGLSGFNPSWLGNEFLVLPSLVVAGSWTYYGFCMVVFLAAIQGIAPEYFEVALLEGASQLQVLRKVTIPLIKNAITLMVINTLIGSFKVFDIIYLLTKGGPYNSSEVIATYVFKASFSLYKVGYGSAMAMVLALIIAIFSIVYIRMSEKND